jgi:hypothetical protein
MDERSLNLGGRLLLLTQNIATTTLPIRATHFLQGHPELIRNTHKIPINTALTGAVVVISFRSTKLRPGWTLSLKT